jgi:magnesium-transporting ATPase (P-type)
MSQTEHPVLVSILLVVLGVLWLVWLWQLHSAYYRETASPTKCHQVSPTLRCTLLVFAVLLVVSAMFYITHTIASDELPSSVWYNRMSTMAVLLVIFLAQILYIVSITQNKNVLVTDCSKRHKVLMYVLGVFALVQIGAGICVFTLVRN